MNVHVVGFHPQAVTVGMCLAIPYVWCYVGSTTSILAAIELSLNVDLVIVGFHPQAVTVGMCLAIPCVWCYAGSATSILAAIELSLNVDLVIVGFHPQAVTVGLCPAIPYGGLCEAYRKCTYWQLQGF